MPVLRPLDARLRQHPLLDLAREVHCRGAQRDRRPGEVHLVFQGWRTDARNEWAGHRFA